MAKIGPFGYTAFVPNGESRSETAGDLTAAAEEFGLSASHVRSTWDGFFISDALADALEAEQPDEGTQTSGDAAKKTKKNTKTKE